jgi:hypothetical protein
MEEEKRITSIRCPVCGDFVHFQLTEDFIVTRKSGERIDATVCNSCVRHIIEDHYAREDAEADYYARDEYEGNT